MYRSKAPFTLPIRSGLHVSFSGGSNQILQSSIEWQMSADIRSNPVIQKQKDGGPILFPFIWRIGWKWTACFHSRREQDCVAMQSGHRPIIYMLSGDQWRDPHPSKPIPLHGGTCVKGAQDKYLCSHDD